MRAYRSRENLLGAEPGRYPVAVQKVIERILNLLAFLLTVGRPVTAEEIRHTVKGYDQPSDEAFRRTFERDKDLLRSLGVPLTTTYTDLWEVEMGYVVPSEDLLLEDPGFTDDERTALLLAAEAVRFGGQATQMDAVFKLGGARRSHTTAPVLADLGQDLSSLGDLFGAVTDRRRIRFDYRNRSRSVEAFGLVHRYGHWYVLGPEADERATVKAFRVDRMTHLEVDEVAGSFERPVDFDAGSALADIGPPSGTGVARILFDADVAEVALHRSGSRMVETDGETALVEVPLADDRSMISWLLGFDDRAVIVEPADLRDRFLAFVGGPS